ncbi:MAG: OmpA family protein [Tannerella sp.]|jgi:peptidoglycan-associated lipoprotein|nr:OmpA family protein [Tannerella sp.]
MTEKRYFGFYLFSFLLLCLCFACKTPKLSQAEEKQRLGEYYSAAAIYRKLYTKSKPYEKDLRAYIAYRMGECNRNINNIPRALSAYRNAWRYEYPDSTLLLRLGQVHQQSGLYPDAYRYYRAYLRLNPESRLAASAALGCQRASDWLENPTRCQINRMDIFNSRRSEFCPMLYGEKHDQLYFASTRGLADKDSVSGITGLKNNTFFLSKKDENGVWQKPEEVTDPIVDGFDVGTPSFSADGNTMYYTYCAEDASDPRTAEIYFSTRSGAAWGKGQRAAIVRDSLTLLAHPAVSPDGNYLYYAAETIGGYGGKDLFRSRLVGGSDFGPMENLGPDINTQGDELFPYVRDSVTLYFASNGHPGLGGLDLFKATLDSAGTWTVVNMGTPLNSMADDFGITFAGDAEQGFFTSNRNDGRGWDHIYSFAVPAVTVFIEGYVADNEEAVIENGALVRIVGKDGLNVKVPVKPDGSYRVELERNINYVMMASASGYLNQNFELKTDAEERSETYYVDFYLSPVDRPVVVENIFYEFDRAELRPESKEALDGIVRILNDNPHVTIELGAHADRKGPDAYNERLAQRRAQSVVDYLVQSGIDAARLTAKGYGESVPKVITARIAEQYDFLTEGAVLTEEFVNTLSPEQQDIADQLNRRTEFIVTGLEYNLR